jgi:hypothetical protein
MITQPVRGRPQPQKSDQAGLRCRGVGMSELACRANRPLGLRQTSSATPPLPGKGTMVHLLTRSEFFIPLPAKPQVSTHVGSSRCVVWTGLINFFQLTTMRVRLLLLGALQLLLGISSAAAQPVSAQHGGGFSANAWDFTWIHHQRAAMNLTRDVADMMVSEKVRSRRFLAHLCERRTAVV